MAMWPTITTSMLLTSPSQLTCCYPPPPSRWGVRPHTHTHHTHIYTHKPIEHAHTHSQTYTRMLNHTAHTSTVSFNQTLAHSPISGFYLQGYFCPMIWFSHQCPPPLFARFFLPGCVHRSWDPSCHLCQCYSRCGPSWSFQPVPHQHQWV